MKVKRMGITEILRRIWLFSANKIKSSESGSKQPTQLIVEFNSSIQHIIFAFFFVLADSSNSTSNVTTSSSIAKSIEATVARISVITTKAATYETTVPTTSTEPITTTKTIVPTSYRKVTSIIAKKATTIKVEKI